MGFLLSLATIIFAAVIGLDRDRSFFATVMFVIASYYVLFAVMGASHRTLIIEIVIASGFFLVAVVGFKGNLWLVTAALLGHGIFDFVRSGFISNPGAAMVAGFLRGIRCDLWRVAGGTAVATEKLSALRRNESASRLTFQRASSNRAKTSGWIP